MPKDFGSNDAIMKTPIFEQEQITRAVELKLGVSCADEIEIVADDADSALSSKTSGYFVRKRKGMA